MTAGSRPLRADAARNRDKLLRAATTVFGERGLEAPLEEVARRAGVSIGTLYNHFPTREALFGAIFPERLAALERLAAAALDDPSPWGGFVGYVEGLFALQAEDRGLNDAIAQGVPAATELNEASRHCLRHTERVIERAKESGRLRADFEPQDLAVLIWAMSQVIRQSMDTAPRAWRRCLGFFLDGLRADAAHSLAEPALTQGQMIRIVERSVARN